MNLVDGNRLVKTQCDCQVNRVKSPQVTAHPMLADEIAGEQIALMS